MACTLKRLVLMGLTCVLMGIWALPSAADPLRVGVRMDAAPFSVIDPKSFETERPSSQASSQASSQESSQDPPPHTASGFAVDLIQAVGAAMDMDIRVQPLPLTLLLERVRSTDPQDPPQDPAQDPEGLDAVAVLVPTQARSAMLDFSVPVALSHGAVFVADDGPSLATEADLTNLRLGVVEGGAVQDIARTRPWGRSLVGLSTLADAFRCLMDRQCDAVVAPRLQALVYLDSLEVTPPITASDLVLEDFGLPYAMAVRKGNTALLARLNDGLALISADGTLQRLRARWLLAPNAHLPGALLPGAHLPGTQLGEAARTVIIGATVVVLVFLGITGFFVMRQRRLNQAMTRHHRDLTTERERRRRADAEAAAIVRMLPDLMVRLDADGRYVDLHDPGQMAIAPLLAERGCLLEDVMPPDLAGKVRQAMARIDETGEMQTLDYSVQHSVDGTRWYQSRMVAFDDGGYLALIRDVTETYRHADQLTQAAAAIASASAAKSRLLATMNHELRTPLNAIIGFSQMMESEFAGPLGAPQYREYAHDIHTAGQSLLTLVSGVMEMAQIEAGRTILTETDVDLGAVAAHRVAQSQKEAEEQGTCLKYEAPSQSLIVRADAGFVHRMVDHLISNAIKFSPEASVRVGVRRRDDAVTELWVSDTGVGMNEDQLQTLGEPFYQTSPMVARTAGGFGLGVSLVREMISLHGGSLRYDSRPGKGTVARLRFPADRAVTDSDGSRHLKVVRSASSGTTQGHTSPPDFAPY